MTQPLYFISDLHFHIDRTDQDDEKIRRLTALFGKIKQDNGILYIVGDLFDFWFEYRYAIPRQHFDLLRMLDSLVRDGIEVHYFAGNHDYWIGEFFSDQLGIQVHPDPITLEYEGKKFWICHGDGVLADDRGYHLLKRILRHPLSIRLFKLIHPDWGFQLAKKVASTSRKYNNFDIDKNRLLLQRVFNEYVLPKLTEGYDYVVMGHLHHPCIYQNNAQVFVNLGDWLHFYSFAQFDGKALRLHHWDSTLTRKSFKPANNPGFITSSS